MNKLNIIGFVGLFIWGAIMTFKADGQECLWAKSAGGSSNISVNCSATDESGNTYIAGDYTGDTAFFDNAFILNTNSSSTNVFVAKYDPLGNFIWVKHFGGIYVDHANSIAVDAFDNVYITGMLVSPTVMFGNVTVSNPGTTTYLAKLNSDGDVIWVKSEPGIFYSNENFITVDKSNNIFMTGDYVTSITFGGITLSDPSNMNGDIFLVKYDSSGAALWARGSTGANVNNKPTAVCTDQAGNVYITGEYEGTPISFGSVSLIDSQNYVPSFLVKYNEEGNVIWADKIDGSDWALSTLSTTSLTTDYNENVYLLGNYYNYDLVIDTFTLTNSGGLDIFLVKYDSMGNALWAKNAGGGNNDVAYSMIADSIGRLFVTGGFGSTSINFGNDTLSNPGIFLAGYNSSGDALWAKDATGNNSAYGISISKDAAGALYIVGRYQSQFTIDDQTLAGNPYNNGNLFIEKFDNIPSDVKSISDSKVVTLLYPNPAINYLEISSSQNIYQLRINNVLGQLVYSYTCNENKIDIDVSKFSTGIYFVNINGRYIKEFVKE